MEEKKADRIIEERKNRIKEIFLKDNYVTVFSIIAVIALVLSFLLKFSVALPYVSAFRPIDLFVLGIFAGISAALAYFDKKKLMFIPLLLWLIWIGIYIRALPMSDHGGLPGLWDITTNTWTLGPDLDPFLFLRDAKSIVEQGGMPPRDMFRNFPLGFDNSYETKVLPYMIAYTYYFLHLFSSSVNVEYAAAVFPVIMFVLTILAFFLFVREIFIRKGDDEKNIKAEIIALISTFFMIIAPVFLSRTIAGIPEKESAGFFFMFLAFYLFLKAWKSDKQWKSIILGILAGIATALMGLIWGGVTYVFITIAVATFMAFILNKIQKKEIIVYSSWLLISFAVMTLFTNKVSLIGLITSLDTGLALIVLVIIGIHFIVWNTKIKNIKFIGETKIPKNILSLIIGLIVIFILALIVLGPSGIIGKFQVINQMMFRPVTGRWSTTVAENRQPYFTEWGNSFGPMIKNIPIMFWLFFIGAVVLFRKMFNTLKKKDAWILTGAYVLFFFGLVFSRYSSSSVLNGENFISKIFYYGAAIIFLGLLAYYYNQYHKAKEEGFDKIEFEFILLFVLFVLSLFTARSAVRLIMVLGPIAPIFLAYLVVESITALKKTKEEILKITLAVIVIVLLVASIFIFVNYYGSIKAEAYSYVPSPYTQQWQKAMSWVRDNTPVDAVFEHWWDYGYWVQTMGNRATVTDGGNALVYWNYLSGRYVLTSDNEKEALDFSYSHNATYLLIDSSDLGKYGAFSTIGSNKEFDRASNGPTTMLADSKSIKETKDSFILGYNIPTGNGQIAISSLEEDISIKINNSQVNLMKEKTGLIGVDVELTKTNNSINFKKAEATFYNSNGEQIVLPLRYVYYNNTFVDFGEGLHATAYIIPRVSQTSIDPLGAVLYISPRLNRGMLSQVYLLNDPLHNFPHFKLVHSEPSILIDSINKQGYSVNEISYIDGRGLEGPIKIWQIDYPAGQKVNPDYLETATPASIDWQF